MKVYISADIEGIAGIAHWDEASVGKHGYEEFRERMTAQVAAACEGAVAAGADEILVKDAHATGRNILADRLPRCARLLRGWSGHPLMMVEEIDDTFDAALMIGYHARAGSGGNPLAHTMSSSRIALLTIGGMPVSEFHLHTWAAALHGVPVVFVAGDEALCAEVSELNPNIRTAAMLRGIGGSTLGLHPAEAEDLIRSEVESALRGDLAACAVALPDPMELRIRYRAAEPAYAAGFFPGCRRVDDLTVAFPTEDYFEVLRALLFLCTV